MMNIQKDRLWKFKYFPLKYVVLVLAVLLNQYCWADSSKLLGINYSVLPGNLIELSLDFSTSISVPQHFPIDNPARIVLDFPDVQLATQKHHSVGVGVVEAVDAVEAGQRTRVVLNLVRTVPYEVFSLDKRLIVSVGTQPEQTAVQPPVAELNSVSLNKIESTPFDMANARPRIENVDFRRTEDGGGRIIVTLSVENAIVNMEQESNQIKLYFRNVGLPENLDRTLDVTDFATPVLSIDARQGRDVDDVVMSIKTTGSFEHFSYQTDNKYFLEITQKIEQPDEKIDITKKQYKGQKISCNFSSIQVGSVLSLLADLENKNIVVPDTIKDKKVSLRLKNVPIDQAWDIILHSNNLGYEEIGNVRTIDLKENIDERRKKELESLQKLKELEPLITEFIPINYSEAENFKTLLRSQESGPNGYSFLSGRGNISVDTNTNTLLIQDTAERLDEIRKVVQKLDIPKRQVLIESRVVIASDSFAKDLGVSFGQTTNGRFGNDREWSIITSGNSTNTNASTPGDVFIVDLPAEPAVGTPAIFGLAVGKVGTYLLQLELSALQSEGRGQVISSPRIVTADKEKATVKQGVEVAVVNSAGVGATAATTFKEVVLKLDVTPKITPDNRVIMDLEINKDNPGSIAGSFETRSIKTKVLVNNGETIVLGGVYEQNQNQSVRRVPFFGDLPFIGGLFRNKQTSNSKQELLIFVTPKILQDNAS